MNVKQANRKEIQSRRKLKTQVATSFYAPAAGGDANKSRAVFGDRHSKKKKAKLVKKSLLQPYNT